MSSPIAYAEQWPAVAAQNLTADGSAAGLVTVPSTDGFYVLQTVTLSGTGKPTTQYRVVEVAGPTTLYVGPLNQFPLRGRAQGADVSTYTTAATSQISAALQRKLSPTPQHELESTVMTEPTNAQRVMPVDERGQALVRIGKYERGEVAGTAVSVTTPGTALPLLLPTQEPKTLILTNTTDKEVMITAAGVNLVRLPAGSTGSALARVVFDQGANGGGIAAGVQLGVYNTAGTPTVGNVEAVALETR